MKKTVVIGLILSAMTALMALITWILPLVAEYPGVERSLEKPLPSWFTGSAALAQPISEQTREKESPKEGQAREHEDHTVITGTEVEIEESEYKLEPNQITLQVASLPVTVTFVLHNKGRFSHDFQIHDHSIDAKAPKFGPGKTIRFEVTLTEEGEYHIMCPLSNHEERGMRGTLVVQAQK